MFCADELAIHSDKFTQQIKTATASLHRMNSSGSMGNMESLRTQKESGSCISTTTNEDVEVMQEFMFGGDSNTASSAPIKFSWPNSTLRFGR